MNRAVRFLAVLSLCLAAAAGARERDGVQLSDTVDVEGKQLSLVGMGLRIKFIFKVYVAGLYMETPSQKAEDVIAADQTKRVVMVMLRDLDKKQISDAILEGFKRNAAAQMEALKERLDTFIAQIPNAKAKESLIISYIPGKGTVVTTSAGQNTVVPGKDFADALFSVWLGKNPVDEGLKKGMLGG